jgi:hypothetical protein
MRIMAWPHPPLASLQSRAMMTIMKNKEVRKIQVGSYTKRSYKLIRRKVKKMVEKDLNIKLR